MKFSSKETKLTSSQKTMAIELGLADQKKAIELLYSQYSNPIQTCVQELVSNAFDAHTQAGKEHVPVKVTIPTALNDYTFSVRDSGNSMDDYTIKNYYMKVNASTKDKDNKQKGGFGIGSKTPWSYTDTFVLKTFLDGIETHYLLVKGRSSVNVIYKGETEEPNGVEVTFKAKERDVDEFKRAVQRISLCANVKPEVNFQGGLSFNKRYDITSSVRFVESPLLAKGYIYINLGGVLYDLGESFFYNGKTPYRRKNAQQRLKGYTNNSTIIIDAPIGSILPLQTRESLFTKGEEGLRNKAMVKSLVKFALGKVEETLDKERSKVVDVKTAINYFKQGLIKDNSRFTFGEFVLNFSEIQLNESKFTIVTRKSKRYGVNERGRKENTKWLKYKDIANVYFSELSGNKARLVSRFHDLNAHAEVVVFEKELMEEETYNTLKEIYSPLNIETVDVPKRVGSSKGSTRNKNKVVWYYYNGGRGGVLDLRENSHKKTIVISKDSNLTRPEKLYNSILGFRVIAVAGSNLEKVLALPNHFTEEQAYNEQEVLRSYIAYRVNRSIGKLSVKNEKFIMKHLSENKQNLFKVGSGFSTNSFWGQHRYRTFSVVEELEGKHGRAIDKAVKGYLKRRARAWVLASKVPLVVYTDLYKLPNSATKDLSDYVKAKLGASNVR